MQKRLPLLAGILIAVLLTVAACSAPAAAEPTVEADAPQQTAEAAPETAEPTDEMATEEVATEAVTDEPAEEAADPTGEAADDPAAAGAAGATTFTIVPEETEARFKVQEVLNGNDTLVVGVTNVVEGQIVANYDDPAGSTVGPITVDLSDLATDNNFRNRAIHEFILTTGQEVNQFAEFTSTSISGMPDAITVGEPFSFQLTGDVTMHGVTRELTFDVTVTPVSETRLEGLATTEILYTDFDINIPRLPPQVASVEENVTLELAFVATAE